MTFGRDCLRKNCKMVRDSEWKSGNFGFSIVLMSLIILKMRLIHGKYV